MKPLVNTNKKYLAAEVATTERNIENNLAWVTVLKGSESASALLDSRRSLTHKWLVTDKGEMLLGSFRHDQVYSTHASFAEFAASRFDTSATVVAAGEFKVKGSGLVMTNYSGHYKTPYDRLWPVKMHMEQLGIKVKVTRQSYLADSEYVQALIP